MIERELINKFPGAVDFSEPQTGRKVNEFSYCPRFEQRRSSSVPHKDCFYCRFADFKLKEEVYPEMGDCKYPEVQVK